MELISAIRAPDGRISTSEEEIKEIFANSMSFIVGCPLDVNGDYQDKLQAFWEPVENAVTEVKRLLLGRPFSLNEIGFVVKSLRKKSPQARMAEVLQEMLEYPGQDLCNLLNACRRDLQMPEDVNTGQINLISKGGERLDTRNYRPLTML